MKKIVSLLLSVAMVMTLFVGCGSTTGETQTNVQQQENASKLDDAAGDLGNASQNSPETTAPSVNASYTGSFGSRLDNVSYVMIYNPLIYREGDYDTYAETATQSTGSMSSQIVVGMNKAGGLEPEFEIPNLKSQAENDANVDLSGVNREGVRAGAMDPEYDEGDRHDFYHSNETMKYDLLDTFECAYEGEYCYIWSLDDSISSSDAEMMGIEFDTSIYTQMVESFGKARFTENGGKINLLFYPMEEGLGGYFTTADIFSSTEVTEEYCKQNGFNVDHAIIHINSNNVINKPDFAKSTMAHEFQHLICASDCFEFAETPWMEVWLNEAMSAYAEELIYPGIKEAGYYNQLMYLSDRFRKGQSLYNFDTTDDDYIGAYGAVYLFSRYLEQFYSPEVFPVIHMNWRYAYTPEIKDSQALAMALVGHGFDNISTKYLFSSEISEQLPIEDSSNILSYLTLDFYIETLKPDLANLYGLENEMRASMLYTEVEPVAIEGGGRIVVATQNGSYEVPADADPYLVYVGLDADFNVVDILTGR